LVLRLRDSSSASQSQRSGGNVLGSHSVNYAVRGIVGCGNRSLNVSQRQRESRSYGARVNKVMAIVDVCRESFSLPEGIIDTLVIPKTEECNRLGNEPMRKYESKFCALSQIDRAAC